VSGPLSFDDEPETSGQPEAPPERKPEAPPPAYSEWSGAGSAGNGEDYNLEAFVAAEVTLGDHLAEQLAVERVREGDALALEMIFTAYRRELLQVAQRIVGAPELAEDVVQEVFLTIWARRERWHVAASLRAYLRRAVHNGAVTAGESRARRAGIDVAEVERATPAALADESPAPDEQAERAEFGAALAQATRELPPRAREVFTLKRVHHLTNREIAARLGLSVSTVEIHMTRALAALRRRLAAWRG